MINLDSNSDLSKYGVHLENRIIQLRYRFNKSMSVYVRPKKDFNGYKGIIQVSASEALNIPYTLPKGTTTLELKDGTTFNLSQPQDALNWHWIKEIGIVAKSFDQLMSASDKYLFYVYDQELETKNKMRKSELRLQAMTYVSEDDPETMKLRSIKLIPEALTATPFTIKDILEDLLMEHPQKVIDLYEQDDAYYSIMFSKGLVLGLIKEERGFFQFGSKTLGANIEDSVRFLSNVRSSELVEDLKAKLKERDFDLDDSMLTEKDKLKTRLMAQDAKINELTKQLQELSKAPKAKPKKS